MVMDRARIAGFRRFLAQVELAVGRQATCLAVLAKRRWSVCHAGVFLVTAVTFDLDRACVSRPRLTSSAAW
jgi:hypothetical protein